MPYLSAEIAVALISGAIGAFMSAYALITQRISVRDLRQIIDELRKRIDELESENHDLKGWAEELVCQVEGAGKRPVEFVRHRIKNSD